MPTWKKVVVSGSGVSQLSNDANYLVAQQDGAILSGSFSGSFVGDGSNLTGIATNLVVSGSTGNDSLNLKTEALSIVGDGKGISTSVDSVSNTISLVTNGIVSGASQIQDLGFASDAELNASSSTLQGNIDAVDSRVSDLEAFSASLDSAFATEAELYAATASLSSSAEAARASLESSLIADLNSSSSTLQSNIDSAISTANSELNASSSTLQSNIDGVESSLIADLNASSSTLQSNIDTKASIVELNASSSTLQSNIDAVAADVAALGDTYATDAELNASSSTLQGNIDFVQSSLISDLNASSSTLQNNIDAVDADVTTAQAGVDGLNTYSASLKDAISLSGQNVTIVGDLTVSGTTTTVNSTTVDIGDNIIALNGTGATNAGLLVNDPDGPASGSLIWKGDQNAWYAGGEGSEVKVLLASGDNVISGSQQIQDLGFASDAELNASSSTLQSNIDTVQSNLDSVSSSLAADITALGDTYATDAELNASSSTLQGNIDFVQSSLIADLNTSSSTLQGNIDSLESSLIADLNASSSTLQSNIDGVESSAEAALNASSSILQGNIDTKADISALNASSSTLQSNIDGVDSRVTDLENFSSSLDAAFASEAELNASSSTLQSNIDGVQSNLDSVSSSIASDIASNDVDITALQSFSSSVDTAMSFDGQNVTVAGNLTVEGTTTTINATELEIEDNLIHLNSGAAQPNVDIGFVGHWNDGAADTHAGIFADASDGYTFKVFSGSVGEPGQSINTADASFQLANFEAKNITAVDITVSGTVDGIDLQAFSASADSRLDSLEAFSSSLDGDFASEAELNASSSTLQGNIDSLESSLLSDLNASSSTLQSNIDAEASTRAADDLTLQGNIDALESSLIADLNASSSTLQSNIDGVDSRVADLESFSSSLDSIYATEAEMNATSASVKTYADDLVANLSQTVAVSGSTGNDSIDLKTEALSIVGDGAGITTSVAANTVTISANGLVSSSVEGDAQGQIKLNGVNVDVNGLGSNDSPTFNNLVVNGNLTTLGTVTNVNTTDLNIEDKFILLNSGSASGNSGLIVQNSATVGLGTALFFDDSASRWALDYSGADAIGDTATADAYVAAVVTTDDPNYQKDGNIRVDSVSGEAYIFVS